MTGSDPSSLSLVPLDLLAVDVLTDDVRDNYVSKTLFAVSEFANVIRGGATVISGEVLLCANLGFGLRFQLEACLAAVSEA
jgi:7,8-dihydropterin-6-yl-methyl-4-(beta-D-ribofuranosyl)aminobenzene 5'-phosphate synthase